MKNFFTVISSLIIAFAALTGASCGKPDPFINSVTELRQNVYEGVSDNYKLKAAYGYEDNEKNERVYRLTFLLCDKTSSAGTYTLTFNSGELSFTEDFKYSPVTGTLKTSVAIENFTDNEFNVTVSTGGAAETVTLKSLVTGGAMDYKTALTYLKKSQPELIALYNDENGDFSGKVTARILVKNEKPYWYVGLKNESGALKALLVDGLTGEVLAVREVF
ncbi:MAG TPA: hypothetical protein DEV87_01670 [Clostridiales bacterium]|nr:hypothetical protein [Clostridiales bacterium]